MSLCHELSDAQREAMVARLVEALADSYVPQHLRGGLLRYFVDGILPGGFLQAVLCMDMPQAMARHSGLGPSHAAFTIGTIHGFLLKHAPPDTWGSREERARVDDDARAAGDRAVTRP